MNKAVLCLLVLSGCAAGPWPTYSNVGRVSSSYEWIVTPDFRARCGSYLGTLRSNVLACAVQLNEGSRCLIFSDRSEAAASFTRTDMGDFLRDHELEHCRGGRHS